MIRFCDKEVYIIYETDLENTNLFTYFCQKEHTTDIIAVYNHANEFLGIITYELLLYGGKDPIQRQFLVVSNEVFQQATELLKNNDYLTYIPILNEKSELIYFCYYSFLPNEKIFKQIISDLSSNNDLLFIRELYPKIQVVCLHDLNELSYLIYQLLIKRGVPTMTTGSSWQEILAIEADEITSSSYSQMHIYAEGTPFVKEETDINNKHRFDAPPVWGFLYDIACCNQIIIENIFKNDTLASHNKCFISRIPMFDELKRFTLDESFRHTNQVVFYNDSLNTKNELIQAQITKIYDMNFEEAFLKYKTPIEKQRIKKFLLSKNVRHYGSGKNNIYVIGPCIVEGNFLSESDELMSHFYKILQNKCGNLYSIISISIAETAMNLLIETLKSISLHNHDMVLFLGQSHAELCKGYGVIDDIDLNLVDVFNCRPKSEAWFMDVPVHTTGKANVAIAEALIKAFILC